jgi:hypothetical protein
VKQIVREKEKRIYDPYEDSGLRKDSPTELQCSFYEELEKQQNRLLYKAK